MEILKVNNVSIKYMTGDFKDIGLKEYVVRKLQGNYNSVEFWANRNISFALETGDMLGIIGANGAGKSTLLKAISGIMLPSEGYVERTGKIAALLELASGFDGDLTVKENTFLRGAMLGYTKDFMRNKYEEIIDFAELSEFQDRPFRQLSSGMKSRLAFSIASMVKPDILILEGLNVLQTGSNKANQTFVSDFVDFSIYVDADENLLKEWYIKRFLKFRQSAFTNPDSYFKHYANLSEQEAIETASNIWDNINGLNLKQNILPTRERANLILRKGENHEVELVKLRK